MLWPSPYPMTTQLRVGGEKPSKLVLPVVPAGDWPKPAFLPPEEDPQLPGFETVDAGNISGYGEISSIDRNPVTRAATVRATNRSSERYPWGTERFEETIEHRTNDEHPESTSVVGSYRMTVELADRTLRWESDTTFRSDLENFYYDSTRRLLRDGELIRERRWEDTIPRDFQ
jgi:hypothetical protein